MAWTFYSATGEVMIQDGAMSIANNTNNRVVTATGADPASLNGEANLTFDGTNLTVGAGNVIIGTAGKGIDFSNQASPAGTMVSELLDHYEEGTWTPQIGDNNLDGSGESQAYDRQAGQYVKIGNWVHFEGSVRITSLGSLTGTQQARIMGLPFTSASTSFHVGVCPIRADAVAITTEASALGLQQPNTAYIEVYEINGTSGGSGLTIAELQANGFLYVSGSYHV
jgi:hypothetical protein